MISTNDEAVKQFEEIVAKNGIQVNFGLTIIDINQLRISHYKTLIEEFAYWLDSQIKENKCIIAGYNWII